MGNKMRIPFARSLAMIPLTALLAGFLFAPAPAVAAGVPVVANADFGQVNSSGVPLSWGRWNPAGAASVTVHPTAGPSGGPAVSIASMSDSTRYALTQSVTVDDSTPRLLRISSMVKGTELSGGLSMLRVQAYNAANQVVVPVAKGPYLSGTFDWRSYTSDITLPPGTTRISIEPMLDRAAGTIWFTNVAVTERSPGAGTLNAAVAANGDPELSWDFNGAEVDHYEVHRTAGRSAPEASRDTRIHTTTAATWADNTVEPAQTYSYVVSAWEADGSMIGATQPRTVSIPVDPPNELGNPVLTAQFRVDQPVNDQVRVSWAVPDSVALPLTLEAGGSSQEIGTRSGALTVPGTEGGKVRLLANGVELSTAVAGTAAHPRAVVSDEGIASVSKKLAEGDATAVTAWNQLLARVTGPDSNYPANGSGGLYRARDAAFAYAVTGDDAYAEIAYEGTTAAAAFVNARPVNMGLELARANLLLAPAYDWAYNGWTENQRAEVRSIMTKSTDLLSTYHHDALDDTEKTSNWVGVVRSTELALLLAARGDGDFGDHDERIAFLTDQTIQHMDQSYTDTGYTQEGWDYFHYTELYLFPSYYFAKSTGLQSLDAAMARPQFWNMTLHVVSLMDNGNVAQFGVSGPSGQVDGTFPLLVPLTPPDAQSGMKAAFDRLQGVDSVKKSFDGVHGLWSLLYLPADGGPGLFGVTAPAAHTALRDDSAGFFAFRNRYQNADDTLIATSGRNTAHRGWSAAETFSLSWLGQDTSWALQGGKHSTEPLLWSKPLVDGKLEPYANQYETERGEGITLASSAFAGQGGGYVKLDGAANFGVQHAVREQRVDLSTGGAADAVVAIHDTFRDSVFHSWDWQLRPGADVSIELMPDAAPGMPIFTLTSPNGAVLSGFNLGAPVVSQVTDGTLRLSQSGVSADFKLVLATSTTGALEGKDNGKGTLKLDGRKIDFDKLDKEP